MGPTKSTQAPSSLMKNGLLNKKEGIPILRHCTEPITLQVHLHTQQLITFLSKLCSPLFESLQFLFRDGAKRMAHHLLKVSDGYWWCF